MQNLQNELIDLLKHEDNLVVDGHLNKNKIIELALKVEPQLISLLIKNETFKKHFFQEVSTVLVFDKIKFQRFVNNKSFLPDSYTAFKNKIGLITNDNDLDNFISTSNDVVLAWPHKDCVLEGGQTKEDQKRNEIFWNETLAPDSVDRLLDAKVFTNFKMFDKDGEHKVTGLKGNENLIIKGNNLLALASLLKTHRGSVKLICIDPPYNTEKDSFKYNDNFSHSTWLTFIKNRLSIAKLLLKKDGLVFISCDDNEQPYLKVLCDEIFGRENFISNLPTIMNLKGNNDEFGFSGTHEYTLVYALDKSSCKINEFDIDEKEMEKWEEDDLGFFKKGATLRSTGDEDKREDRPEMFYPILVKDKVASTIEDEEHSKLYDKISKSFDDAYLDEIINKYKGLGFDVLIPYSDGNYGRWRWGFSEKNRKRLSYDVIVTETKNGNSLSKKQRPELGELPSKKPKSIFYKPEYSSGNGTAQIKEIFGNKAFKNPKPVDLIKDFIHIGSDDNDIILDFFAGSGTTGDAVIQLNKEKNTNRKFILIEQLEYIKDVTCKRVNHSIQKTKNGSYVFAELMQYNQKYIDLIQNAISKEELITVWNEMQDTAFLSYQLDKKTFNERLEAFKTAPLEEMKQYLVEVLDKNQLYVNYSEINDETFKVSQEDKTLNKQFYSKK